MKTRSKTKPALYAAIDLHSCTSVLGAIDESGQKIPPVRFNTSADTLRDHVADLGKDHQISLTIEAAPLARWARSILLPVVDKLIVCDPYQNKLISSSAYKRDELDVHFMCRLLRLGELHEVWCGDNEARQIFREAVQALINFRDQQRELKTLIKSRYRGFGILNLNGKEIFHPEKRQRWLDQLPKGHHKGLNALYLLHDTALTAWREQLREIRMLGESFPEIARFQQVPGVGEVGSAVFSAFVEDPHRFERESKLYSYCALGITSRSSDGKALGYERINRRGQRELKNMSYHAWRTGIRLGAQSRCVRDFYEASKERTGIIRHARLNTQRKILKTLWTMWKNNADFDPTLFLQKPEPETDQPRRKRMRRRRRPAKPQLPSSTMTH